MAVIFREALDLIENEFERRFAADTTTLWAAMEALSPVSKNFLDEDALKPLFDYSASIPVVKEELEKQCLNSGYLKAECRIFKRVLSEKEWPTHEHGKVDLDAVAKFINMEYKTLAPVLCILYNVAVTAGFTSTRVECLFSSLTQVDTAERRSMTTKRECELSYLYFENKVLLKDISFEMFLKEWKLKPRKFNDL